MERNHRALPFALIWAGILLACAAPALGDPIRVGSIGSDGPEEIRKLAPLARYLAQRLQSEGVDQGRVVVPRNIREMAGLFQRGEVDLFIDSAFPTLAVSRLSGSQVLLRRWKKGLAEYRSVLITAGESGVAGLNQLKGRMVAMDEPFSTSGYFIPKVALRRAGLVLGLRGTYAEPMGPHEVGYVFSWSDETTIAWLLRDKVAAGAIDSQTFSEQPPHIRDRLRAIHETAPMPW